MNNDAIILDAQPSMRRKDSNGYLHIEITPISKACVNPYLGREIAGSEAQGWDANKIYYGLRDPDELAKAAKTFNGMPVLLQHHTINAENPAKEWVVGSIGTDGTFEKPYLKNSMTITDAQAIKYIEDGTAQEISCSYRFKPEFKSGEYTESDGSKVHYDFIMRDIEGNHVALVPEGRAGHDVKVADSNELINKATKEERRNYMKFDELIEAIMPNASVEDKALALDKLEELASAEDSEVEDAKKAKDEEKDVKKDYDADKEVLDDEDEEVDEEEEKDVDEEEVDDENLDALLKDPKAKAAFEMGVRYGEKREKADTKRIDGDHESTGMKKYWKKEKAMTKDSIAEIEDYMMDKFRAINSAAKKVRPLVGEISDPFAFDSAEAIYAFALDKNGQDIDNYPVEAFEGMVDMILQNRPSYVAMDSALNEECNEEMGEFMDALNNIE